MTRALIIVMLTVLASVYSAAQQDVLSESFKLAQTYERSGDLRNASRIYQELYAKQPSEVRYFDGVVRTLVGLQQFAALLPLVEERVQAHPTFDLSVLEAQLAWRTGAYGHADSAWARAAELGTMDGETTWAMIAESQAGLLLFPRAIASYRKARAAASSPTAYCSQLSSLYASIGDYRNGIAETLLMLEENENIALVQGRLSSFMLNDTARTYLGTVIERTDNEADMLRLRAWYYRETKQWDKAIDATQRIDDALRTAGQELYQLGDALRRDGNLDAAERTYSLIMQTSRYERFKLSALYGYARVMEQKLRLQPVLAESEARAIVDRYRSILTSYPQHPLAAEALYHMAVITDEYLHDADGARDMLVRLIGQYRGTPSAAEGALTLASLYLASGHEDLADRTLADLAALPQANLSNERDVALVRRGDLRFYHGHIDSAATFYRMAASRPGSAAANDALERLLIIELADRDTAAVLLYSQAELRTAQRVYGKAAGLFVQAADSTHDADLRDRCRYEAAVQYVKAGDDTAAATQLRNVLSRVPDSIFGDKALFLAASIQERHADPQGAIQTLSTLLAQYPRSILVPETRDRIRRLRGDA